MTDSPRSKITRVGIGISCYNRIKNVRMIVQSLRSLGVFEKYYVVFSSDGCTDGTQEYLAEQKDFTSILNKNGGIATNKNRLLRALKEFRFIFILEDDILPIETNFIEETITLCKRTGLYHFNYGQTAKYRPYKVKGVKLLGSGILNGQFIFLTQKTLRAAGYLNPRFRGYGYEHCEYTHRICRCGLYKWGPFYAPLNFDRYFNFLPENGGMKPLLKLHWRKKQSALYKRLIYSSATPKLVPEPKEKLRFVNQQVFVRPKPEPGLPPAQAAMRRKPYSPPEEMGP